MQISFDLDDTLILYDDPSSNEKLLSGEILREGTTSLLQELAKEHELWIYTTSFRSPWRTKFYFWLKGIKIHRVINQNIHDEIMKGYSFPRTPSKLPSHFGIDIHIDDADGVVVEGREFGFDVIQVRPNQENWIKIILQQINQKYANHNILPRFINFTFNWQQYGSYPERSYPFGLPRLITIIRKDKTLAAVINSNSKSSMEIEWEIEWIIIPEKIIEKLFIVLKEINAYNQHIPLTKESKKEGTYLVTDFITGVYNNRSFHILFEHYEPEQNMNQYGEKLYYILHDIEKIIREEKKK